MLSLFRTNQFLISIFLIPYAVLIRFSHLFASDLISEPSTGGLLGELVHKWIGIDGYWADIFALGLIVFQAILINAMVITNRLSREISLLPGVFYILIASVIPDFLGLTPALMANTFYIIAIGELMAIYKRPSSAGEIFNFGFWVALGSLFYFPTLIFLILGIIGLNILRAFRIDEILMLLIGAFVPYFLTFCFFFWNDQSGYFWTQQFHFQFGWGPFNFPNNWESYLKIGIIMIFILVIFFSYNRYVFKQNIEIQKKISLLFWAIILGFLTPFLVAGMHLDHLLLFAVPVAILLSFNALHMQSRAVEALHIIVLAAIFYLQYVSFF